MAVIKIPPDGAAKRFKASQQNLMAEKKTLMETSGSNPRDKIKVADAMRTLRDTDGWKMIEMWYTSKWSFRNIMQIYRGGNEKEYSAMMIQRELIEMIEDQMDSWIEAGQKARDQLAEQDREQAGK